MVPIIDLTEENLDRRIQRIRERDEEIEKKHREAEADRLNALKMNAMVKIKPTTDDDWPRAHKYDTHDFGNEVKDNETPTIQPHSAKLNRKPKYSFEFQGPPADPFYYFLTDVERGDNPPPPQPSREERTSVNSARKHINRKPNGIANNTAKNRVANNLPLKRSGFPRMHRQKTDEIGLKRESETERINAMFPLASRVIGPLKLAGGDYYTKKFHRSRSSGDLDVEKRRSKSAHVSRHSDTKVVRFRDDTTHDRSQGRAHLLSMIAIPHRKVGEMEKDRGERERNRTRDRTGHTSNSGTFARKTGGNTTNGHNRGHINKNGTIRTSVQDRLARHRSGH